MKVHILLKSLRKKRIEKGLINLLLSLPALVADLHQNACYSVRAYTVSTRQIDKTWWVLAPLLHASSIPHIVSM
jgi:hypothetical protein